MKEKCICTTFKLSVAAVAGVALASVAFAEGQRPAGNPLGNKSPLLEQRVAKKRELSQARTNYYNKLEARKNVKGPAFEGIAGPCPNPDHDCCTTGTPGCSDTACCNTVCGLDAFCCNNAWDSICVNSAGTNCGPEYCGSACPNPTHDCCTTGTAGCSDTACCETVCAIDPFCCDTFWDINCVGPNAFVPGGSTIEACGIKCAGPCPNPAHDCCTTGGPGCSDTACCEAVCAVDTFCCAIGWDAICVSEVALYCAEPCPSPCDPSNPHDCFTTGGPGCNDVECCEAVCCVDSFCCLIGWDSICVSEAQLICGDSCEVVCPDDGIDEGEPCGDDTNGGCNSVGACSGASGNCCFANGGIGCEDPVCSSAICAADSFCCAFAWDGICAAAACADDVNCQCDPATGDPFVEINCGDTVCGTMWADGNFRDTDWYRFCVTYCGTLTNWSVYSEVPAVAFILNNDCGALVLIALGTGNCPVRAEAGLQPGTYIAFAAPAAFNCYPCGGDNDYIGVLSCQAPRIDETCPGDIAGGGNDGNLPNGTVDTDDLLKVINNWGDCDPTICDS